MKRSGAGTKRSATAARRASAATAKRATAKRASASATAATKTGTTKARATKTGATKKAASKKPATKKSASKAAARGSDRSPRGASGAQRWSLAEFVAAGDLRGDGELDVGGHLVALSHLERAYFPRPGYTKGDLLRYYAAVAPLIVPKLADRPAILKRHPRGVAGPSFFQHDMPSPPPGVATAQLRSETGRLLHYAVYSDLGALLALVNLGTIAHNPWHARLSDLAHPDYVVFDLDPQPAAPFEHVLAVALALRDVLRDEAGLAGLVKTSGSRGLHIYVPVRAEYSFERVADFSEAIAARVAARRPDIATVARALASRGPRQIYVDWQQNAIGKSAASVYSVRAVPDATVAAPVTWDEVERGAFTLADFTIGSMPARIDKVGDLWASLFTTARQALPAIAPR